MSVNSYLTNLANAAIVRDQEQASIRRSVAALQDRLRGHFGDKISEGFIFGSYKRSTILPRFMDVRSDVDYMVVFTDGGVQPQTYLNRLKRFVECYYSRSEIAQSHPTIALSLNHIRFELVPALRLLGFGRYSIPDSPSPYPGWITTEPNGFNDELTRANQANKSLIKPLIRLIKFWNARNGYPFASYVIEQQVVRHGFWSVGLLGGTLQTYFYEYILSMEEPWGIPQRKDEAIRRAKRLVESAQEFERLGNSAGAERTIRQLLPPLGLGLLAAE